MEFAEKPDTWIEDIELARDMAYAMDPYVEQLIAVKGLSEAITEIEVSACEILEEQMVESFMHKTHDAKDELNILIAYKLKENATRAAIDAKTQFELNARLRELESKFNSADEIDKYTGKRLSYNDEDVLAEKIHLAQDAADNKQKIKEILSIAGSERSVDDLDNEEIALLLSRLR